MIENVPSKQPIASRLPSGFCSSEAIPAARCGSVLSAVPSVENRRGPIASVSPDGRQATGVTEGKLETQSGTSTPRSSSAPKVGARPSSTARWSMSVRSEST